MGTKDYMKYDEKQLRQYAYILAMYDTPSLFALLTLSDPELSKKIARYHIMIIIVEAIIKTNSDKPTLVEIRDYMHSFIFKKTATNAEIEKKLEQYLPLMKINGLLDDKLLPTSLARQAYSEKVIAAQANRSQSTEIN